GLAGVRSASHRPRVADRARVPEARESCARGGRRRPAFAIRGRPGTGSHTCMVHRLPLRLSSLTSLAILFAALPVAAQGDPSSGQTPEPKALDWKDLTKSGIPIRF